MFCNKCNVEKKEIDFGKKGAKLNRTCKNCVAAHMREYNLKTGKTKRRFDQPKKCLLGLKFGNLQVIQNLGTFEKRRFWLCRCVCGTEKRIAQSHFTRKNSPVSSCGCLQYKIGEKNKNWKGFGEISLNRWGQIKRTRKGKQKEFTITIKEAWELFLKQNKKCALTGLPIFLPEKWKAKFTATLDRIDSNKGYVVGNVQWIHKDINWMKNDFDQDYFIDLCKTVASFRH